MKTKVLLLASALTLSLTAGAAVSDFSVNGTKVTAAEQEQLLSAFAARGQKRTPQLEAAVKQDLIARTAVLQAAEKSGVAKNPKVVEALNAAHNQIVSDAYLVDYLKKNPVAEADMKAAYDAEKARYGKNELNLSRISVKTEADAKAVQDRLKKGEAFAKVAREQSADKRSAQAGGAMGWVNSGAMPSDLAAKISALKDKETLVAPGPFGFDVIQKSGSRAAKAFPAYEQLKPEINRQLSSQKAAAHVQDLVSKAVVK